MARKKKVRFSIIIAVGKDNPRLRRCLRHCLELGHGSYEIIVLPDKKLEAVPSGVLMETTGKINPSHKRDRGAELASGEILAFLDDDAYPRRDWLRQAEGEFADESVGAAGGPGLTPPDSGFWEKAGGLVYETPLGGGNYMYRYRPMKRKDVDDFPTCNLFVRRQVFLDAGGFDTEFWPGEDTKLCLEITGRQKKRIVYSPRLVVYHHRRALFVPHLRQVMSYARHRGYFVKRFPRTSLRPSYFLPTVFDVGLLAMAVGLLYRPVRAYCLWGYAVLGASFLVSTLGRGRGVPASLAAALGCFLTHFVYGIFFIVGLLSRRLKEEH